MKTTFGLRFVLLGLWMGIFSIPFLQAQIPHGGKPLAPNAEQHSMLRSAVDYFVEMPAFDVDSAQMIDDLPGNRAGSLTFAHKFFVDLTPENSGLVFHTKDGTKVWKVGIRSSGAYSLNVLFSEFSLPRGASVFLYNSDQSKILGSFTSENRPEGGAFPVAPVDGDELTIEYQEPANAEFSGKLRISEVNHDYRGLLRTGVNTSTNTLTCIPDLSCESKYDTLGRSVCLMIVNGTSYCTGTLVNNTAGDGKPYLLTVSHCLGGTGNQNSEEIRKQLGESVVVFLNYVTPRCDNRITGSSEFSVSGCKTTAFSVDIDFALLELKEIPPAEYRPYLAGWSLSTETNKTKPYLGIHHPNGFAKKYCVEEDSITKGQWTFDLNIGPNNHWNVRKWEIGHTWGGSSGSPLFDKNDRIRGGLSGGDSGGDTGCGDYSSGDFYFRMDRAWDTYSDSLHQLKYWLDPLSRSTPSGISELDGLDPYAQLPVQRLSNLLPTDVMSRVFLDSPYWGSIFGHNSIGSAVFAEHFTAPDSSMVFGVYLVPAKGRNNSASPVTLRIYKGGDLPGEILGKVVLNPNFTIYSNGTFQESSFSNLKNRDIYLRLDTPVSVGKDFYVGYEIQYPLSNMADTFYVYSALRERTVNTAFFKQNGSWTPYTSHPLRPLSTSMWIEPLIARDTITLHNKYSEKDSNNLLIRKPILSYSPSTDLFHVLLPDEWLGNTLAEVFNAQGIKIMETIFVQQRNNLVIPVHYGQFFVIRLRHGNQICTLKALRGW